MFPTNQEQHTEDYIKSINQTPVINNTSASNFVFTTNPNNMNFLLSNNNNGMSSSTSTSANIQMPSNTSWNFNQPTDPHQQLGFYDNNALQSALSNTTNPNLSSVAITFLTDAINRSRSHSAGNMSTANSIGFSPPLSNNQPTTFNTQTNSFVQMSSSLPNDPTSTFVIPQQQGKSSFNQPNLSFSQPFTISSEYKVSTTEQDSNNMMGTNANTNNVNTVINNGFQQILDLVNFNNSPNNQTQFILQQPQTNQPMNNTNYNPSNILSSLIMNLSPPSPNQLFGFNNNNNNSMHSSTSPSSNSNSPPTQSFSTLNIIPNGSNSTTVSGTTTNTNNMQQSMSAGNLAKSTMSGKQVRPRSVSCASSSSLSTPYQSSSNQFIFNSPTTFGNQDSPKKGNRKSGIKFEMDYMDNAQKFDIKHTSLTPSTMKQHIAERDERERSGVKKRGRPKGTGVKQQGTKGGKLLFYQNCYNSVEHMYKDRRHEPGRDDDNDPGFTV